MCESLIINDREVRLDKETSRLLSDICRRENTDLAKLASRIDQVKGQNSFAGALRLMALVYYRQILKKEEKQIFQSDTANKLLL